MMLKKQRGTIKWCPAGFYAVSTLASVTDDCWCPEGDLNPHSRFRPADFKSAASADFAIRAFCHHRISIGALSGWRSRFTLRVVACGLRPVKERTCAMLKTPPAPRFRHPVRMVP